MEFYLNQQNMQQTLSPLQSRIFDIKISPLAADISGNSQAMAKFVELYGQFLAALVAYRDLLMKDILLVSDAIDVFALMDTNNAGLFNIGNFNNTAFSPNGFNINGTFSNQFDPIGGIK